MDMKEIHQLIELMNDNELLEIELVEDSKKIRLKKKFEGGPKVIAAPMAGGELPAPTAAPGPATIEPASGAADTVEIKSPMVGTFYRAPNPESPNYSEVGDHVGNDTTVCIVEAMKVFNEIKAEAEGTIVKILVENGDTVEYGQAMFLVKPD